MRYLFDIPKNEEKEYDYSIDVEFSKGIKSDVLIHAISTFIGLPNLGGRTMYSGSSSVDDYLHQRFEPIPEKLKDLPEFSGYGVKILMHCKGLVTEGAVEIKRNESIFDQTQEIAYKKFRIDITPEGSKTITPEFIDRIRNVLDYTVNR